MKNHHRTLRIFLTFIIFLIAGNAGAQSISINSISGTNFCTGDSISVTFTVSGNWSQNKNNAFSIQLSDINGSFSTFKILGSLKDTADGTFTLTSAISSGTGTHYRIRIAGSNPYVPSPDNGQDITMGVTPNVDLEAADFTTYVTTSVGGLFLPVGAQVDSSVQILLPHIDSSASSTTYDWDFGSGATPPNASGLGLIEKDVTYSTAGDKTVSVKLTGPTGCSTSASINYHVFDCTNPSIPKYAVIDSGQNNFQGGKVIWVNPGVTLNYSGGGDTIFCESGSTINTRGAYSVYYLKPGASYTEIAGYNTIIYADGVSLDLSGPPYRAEIRCPNLDFDYTNAPPNVAFPLSGVKNDLNSVSITLSPNPTSGMISVQGLPSDNITVSVFNALGETVMVQKNPSAPDFSLDLSKLAPGTYYLRFSSANSVVTKKVVRE